MIFMTSYMLFIYEMLLNGREREKEQTDKCAQDTKNVNTVSLICGRELQNFKMSFGYIFLLIYLFILKRC